jgi:hypothetical protein
MWSGRSRVRAHPWPPVWRRPHLERELDDANTIDIDATVEHGDRPRWHPGGINTFDPNLFANNMVGSDVESGQRVNIGHSGATR